MAAFGSSVERTQNRCLLKMFCSTVQNPKIKTKENRRISMVRSEANVPNNVSFFLSLENPPFCASCQPRVSQHVNVRFERLVSHISDHSFADQASARSAASNATVNVLLPAINGNNSRLDVERRDANASRAFTRDSAGSANDRPPSKVSLGKGLWGRRLATSVGESPRSRRAHRQCE